MTEHAPQGHDDVVGRESREHSQERAAPPASLRLLPGICLGLTVPTAVFSTGLQQILGLAGPRFPGSGYLSAVCGTAVFVIGGRVFFARAFGELRAGSPGTMTLSSLALLVGFGYSVAVLLGFPGRDFWWQLATLVTVLLLGHGIERRAIAAAGGARLLAETRADRSGPQLLADRAGVLLCYVAVGTATVTLVAWLLLAPADPGFVVERVVAVLAIASPHALGLAIPVVAAIAPGVGARRGILVRDRAMLEAAKDVDVVLVNMTGTLTEGRLSLVGIVTAPGGEEAEVLGLAAAVETGSGHPIAHAILAAAQDRGLNIARPATATALAGRGAQARVGSRVLRVGSSRIATEGGIHLDPVLVHARRNAQRDGSTVVHLFEGDRALATFAFADVIRAESAEAVAALRKRGVRVALFTGDSYEVAHVVAAQLGITEVFAEVLPGQQAAIVERLQQGGACRVAMAGDDVDDASGLAQADVGIAIGADPGIAIQSAGIVLASRDPRGLVDILVLSRAGYRTMRQNLAWATGYNVVGLPLAAGVLAGAGVLVPPAVSAAAMSLSAIVVVLNARRLRRLRFRH